MKTKQGFFLVLFVLVCLTSNNAQVNNILDRHVGPLIHKSKSFDKEPGLKSARSDVPASDLKPLPYTPELALRLQNILDNNPVENMSAAIMFPNGDIWQGVKGYANASTKISSNTVFSIGSITKTFVAATLLKMADEGKLSLDDSIYKFLPKYNNIDSCITVRMLLNHSSGLREIQDNTNFWVQIGNQPNRVWQPEQVLEEFLLSPAALPGQGTNYSNTNYLIAGMIISKISGKELSAALREYTFDPFELGSTTIFPEDHRGSELCGLGQDFAGTISAYSSMIAAGAVISKPYDMVRWTRNLYSGDVFSDTAFKQMIASRVMKYGTDTFSYGLGMQKLYLDLDGEVSIVFGHGGSMANYAVMGYIPGDSVSIAACFKDSYDRKSSIQNLYNEVMGVRGPENDSIINAIELTEGVNGPFFNSTASIENGEPRPPKNGCNTQDGWCQNGGLQNTLWFWFNAPESGVVSFTADGFDNQLAVYQSKNSDSLLNGNYSLLAANDNGISGKYPFIYNLQGLVPYEEYYLQLSGFGGTLGFGGEVGYGGIVDELKINFYKDELKLETDKDTVLLDAAAGSCDSVNISTGGPWTVTGYSGWLKVTPVSGYKSGTITLTAMSENSGTNARKAAFTVRLLGIQSKLITIYQKPFGTGMSQTEQLSFTIAPNPVSDYLKVNCQGKISIGFSICNIHGIKVMSGKLMPDFKNIDVRLLPEGIYFLKIMGENGIQTQKFIKQ